VLVRDLGGTLMKRPKTPLALALAIVALVSACSLVAAAPSADAHYLRTTDVFHFPAWAPHGQKFIPARGGHWLWLDEGYYLNGAYFAHTGHRTDPDLLNERIAVVTPGRYRWRVHRWWSSNSQKYFVKSKLSGPGLARTSEVINELTGNHVYGDGKYEWGGRLVWDGAIGLTEPQH
jgi:hypothetical protein